jgi:hypothetical protein
VIHELRLARRMKMELMVQHILAMVGHAHPYAAFPRQGGRLLLWF